jgi:serine/threonine-protein kinase
VLLVSLATGDVSAQTKGGPAQGARGVSNAGAAAAEALFEEGVALSEKGQWPDACKKFEASQTLDVAVGTLLRLADCYERIGRLASAWARFREARSLAQAQAMPDRERIATLRAEALDAKMARVTIKVPATIPAGFEVTLGDTPVPRASWGSALPVDSGNANVTASAPGYLPFERRVTVPDVGGARLIVIIPPLEAKPAAPAPRAEPRPAPKPRSRPAPRNDANAGYGARAVGVTFGVVGGVGLAAGGALAIAASRRNDKSLDHCPEGPRLCTARGVQLRDEAATLADLATVSTAVGGGLLATGVVVYLVGSSQRSQERVALDVAPDVVARGVSVRARGKF